MRVPEKSPRVITEVPPRDPREEAAPVVFQRTFQYSRAVLFIAVVIGYLLAFTLLLFPAILISDGEFIGIALLFGLFGLGVLAASVKGSWGLAKGPRVYLLTLEHEEIIYGCIGEEQRLPAAELASIHYTVDTDSDGDNSLTLAFKTHAGERIHIREINQLVPRKLRPKLMAFLKTHYPEAKCLISE